MVLLHEFGERGILSQAPPVDYCCRLDQLTTPTKEPVPELDNRKLGHALGLTRSTSSEIALADCAGHAWATSSANAAGERENPA